MENEILVTIDFSESTDAVLAVALETARAHGYGMCLIHVAPPDPAFVGYDAGPQTVRDTVAGELREEHHRLQALAEQVKQAGLDAHSLCIQGPTVEKILQAARERKVARLVMGSHGHGALYHLLMGSVTEGVLREAPCPVLIVPSPGRDQEGDR